jgi:hypothetical protein
MQASRERAGLISLLRASLAIKVVQVKEASSMQREQFTSYVRENVPVILSSSAVESKCVEEWSKEYYIKRAAMK